MKKILAIVGAMTCLTTPIFAQQLQNKMTVSQQARGGADPGGGLVVRQQGQLKLLAEAGLILELAAQKIPVKKYPEYYELKPETIDAVKMILSQLESKVNTRIFGFFKKPSIETVLGKRNTFISEVNTNQSTYSKIKSDYASVLSRLYNKKLNLFNTVMPAYSVADKSVTVILPDFEKLNPLQQALILFHEAEMRREYFINETVAERLAATFTKDAALYELTQSDVVSDDLKLKIYKAYDVGRKDIAHFQLSRIEAMRNRPFLMSELISSNMDSTLNSCVTYKFLREAVAIKRIYIEQCRTLFYFDPSLVQKYSSFIKTIAQDIDGSQINFAEIPAMRANDDVDIYIKAKSERDLLCQKNINLLKSSRYEVDMLVTIDNNYKAVVLRCIELNDGKIVSNN